jgi:hypothetical protein
MSLSETDHPTTVPRGAQPLIFPLPHEREFTKDDNSVLGSAPSSPCSDSHDQPPEALIHLAPMARVADLSQHDGLVAVPDNFLSNFGFVE